MLERNALYRSGAADHLHSNVIFNGNYHEGITMMKPWHTSVILKSALLLMGFAIASYSAYSQEQQSGLALEEVVVTAEKTGEADLQDVALSVTALSEEDINSRQIIGLRELDGKVPGLTSTTAEGILPTLAIRGIGKESSQSSNVESVSAHLDGVFLNSALLLNQDLLDIERIEVLRGPQGTVFGQNSIGGTLNVITKRPVIGAFEGDADISVGTFDLVRPRASVNVPISETLALRAAASYYKHDGYSENDLISGAEPDEDDNFSGRVQLLFQPTENFSALLRVNHYETDTDGRTQKNNTADSTPGRDIAQDFPTKFDYEAQVYSASLEWALPFATVKSLTSYQREELRTQQDNDRGPAPFNNIVKQNNLPRETVTQEINIVSADPGLRLQWVIGAFYMDYDLNFDFLEFQDNNGDGVVDTTIDLANIFGTDLSFEVIGLTERESWSIFGQGSYGLTEQLRLTAGLRYTEDEARGETTTFFLFPSRTLAESKMLTGKIGLDWHIQDDNMLYFSYTRGAKPGGTNIPVGAGNLGLLVDDTFQKEEINAFEIGSKNRFADGKLQLNASAFYYDFSDYQFSNTDPIPFFGGVDNMDEAEVFGIEVEGTALFGGNWRLDANLTYLDTEVKSTALALDSVTAAPIFFDVAAKQAAIVDLDGNDLPKAPEFVANVALSHVNDINNWGELTSTVFYTYRDEYSFRAFNNLSTDFVPSYDTWDLNFRFEPYNSSWAAEFIVTNLEDDDSVSARWTNTFGTAETSDGFIPPRQFIFRLRYTFQDG